MGWAFVKRRMSAELGADWENKFKSFEHHPAAAASLGQVHRAHALDGAELACKLQYPDMQSAVEADLSQLQLLFVDPQAVRSGDRYHRDRQGDRRAPARGARLCTRGQARRALPPHAQRRSVDPRAGRLARAVHRPPVDDGLAHRQQAARTQGRSACRAQPARHRDVHCLVASVQPIRRHPWRSASRQLHGVRRRQGQSRPASTCSTTAASASSRRASSAAWSISIAACSTATTIWWCTPTRPGASSGSTAS